MRAPSEFHQAFVYDPDTGVIRWRIAPRGKPAFKGEIAGSRLHSGYLQVKFKGRVYLQHRLAFYLFYGFWPKGQIDHRNRIKTDNRIKNLREVTALQNQQNRGRAWGRCNLLGASFHKASGKWRASIRTDGRQQHLGSYDTALEAHNVYMREKARLHPAFCGGKK